MARIEVSNTSTKDDVKQPKIGPVDPPSTACTVDPPITTGKVDPSTTGRVGLPSTAGKVDPPSTNDNDDDFISLSINENLVGGPPKYKGRN